MTHGNFYTRRYIPKDNSPRSELIASEEASNREVEQENRWFERVKQKGKEE